VLPNYHKWNEFKLLLFLIFQLLSVLFVEKFKIYPSNSYSFAYARKL